MSSGSQKKVQRLQKKIEEKMKMRNSTCPWQRKPPFHPPLSLQNATMPPLEKYAHAIAHAMHGNRGKCEK